MLDRIRFSKEEILFGLVKLPKHNHRDPAMENACNNCQAIKHFKSAYTKLPSDQAIKEFKDRHGI